MAFQIVEIYELAFQILPDPPVTLYRLENSTLSAPSLSPAVTNMTLTESITGELRIRDWINMIQLRLNPPIHALPAGSEIKISRTEDGQFCKLKVEVGDYIQELVFDKASGMINASERPAFSIPWTAWVQIHNGIVDFQEISEAMMNE